MDSHNGVWVGSCLFTGTLAIALTVACSSDSESPGSQDAGASGSTAAGGESGDSGSANSGGGNGGAANGGSAAASSGGGASSGGAGGGGAANGTGGHATGGSATGGAGAAAGSGGEHGTRDGGGEMDASTDQGGGNPEAGTTRGGHDGGTDGSSPKSVCSPSTDFPAGRYHLQMISELDLFTDPGEAPANPYENTCSLSSAVGTLTITPNATQPTEYDLDFETTTELAVFAPNTFSFVDVTSSTADSISLLANCNGYTCPPDSGAISVVIDEHTGIVTSFSYSFEHVGVGEPEYTGISGVGWLECAGEDAGVPPGAPALGPGGMGSSGYCGVGALRLGCTDIEVIGSPPPTCGPDGGAPDRCGSGSGSCTNEPGSGYVLSCCQN